MTEQLNSNSKSSVNCFLCRYIFLRLLHVTAYSCGSSVLCILSPSTPTLLSQRLSLLFCSLPLSFILTCGKLPSTYFPILPLKYFISIIF